MTSTDVSYKFVNLKRESLTLNISNQEEQLSTYEDEIREFFKISKDTFPTVKYFHAGKPLLPTTKFSQVSPSVYIIVMGSKETPKQPVSQPIPQPPPVIVPQQHVVPPPEPVVQQEPEQAVNAPPQFSVEAFTEALGNTYSVDQIMASIPVFFIYVASNPILKQLFIANPHQFTSIVNQPFFRALVVAVMSQSTQLLNGLTSDENVSINIPTLTMLNQLATQLPHFPHVHTHTIVTPAVVQQPQQSNQEDQEDQESSPDNSNENQDEVEPEQINIPGLAALQQLLLNVGMQFPGMSLGGGVAQNLSEQDETNIQQLMGLGFSREDALSAYIACGKDMNQAATFLFDDGGNETDDY